MGVAHVLTVALGLRYGTWVNLADNLQVRGADVEADYAVYRHLALRATVGAETATYRGDGATAWTGYEAYALPGIRLDAIASDSTLPVRPFLALGFGIAVRHKDNEPSTIPPERTIVAPYVQLAELGLDVHSDEWLVRGSVGFEGVATSAPPVWAFVLGAGRRF